VVETKTFVLASASGKPSKIFRVPSNEVNKTEFWDLRADVWRLYRQHLYEVEELECSSLSNLRTDIDERNKTY